MPILQPILCLRRLARIEFLTGFLPLRHSVVLEPRWTPAISGVRCLQGLACHLIYPVSGDPSYTVLSICSFSYSSSFIPSGSWVVTSPHQALSSLRALSWSLWYFHPYSPHIIQSGRLLFPIETHINILKWQIVKILQIIKKVEDNNKSKMGRVNKSVIKGTQCQSPGIWSATFPFHSMELLLDCGIILLLWTVYSMAYRQVAGGPLMFVLSFLLLDGNLCHIILRKIDYD